MIVRVAKLALEVLGEIVAPTTCAACDGAVRRADLFCAACAPTVLSPFVLRANELAVAAYGGAASAAVLKMKYAGRADLALRLGRAMADAAARAAIDVDVVVPVPLHPKRLAERGFDQASLLAAGVAARLGAPRAARALARVRDTPRQASLDRSARAANVDGAFVCRAPQRVSSRRVLLVDDVRTTGATLRACEAALQSAGARAVFMLVFVARDREG